ncbi:beta-N-acetylhexosaminidase [uncultured Flavobacterium sp.]|uniref:beta-N-acetylhexosaminidase n=1 Tax=uncultured Flavobacterium sp. TaxID=165435 RepID=UPI0025DFE867|nr:beta-N-acetylhexosaminidase [uncultured Flavobacterium sp.]
MKKILCLILLFAMLQYDGFAQQINIIPRPNKLTVLSGYLDLTKMRYVGYSATTKAEATILQCNLKKEYGLEVSLKADQYLDNSINLKVDVKLIDSLGKEGYKLIVSPSKITLKAANQTGIYYGIQSLQQAIDISSDKKQLALMTIEDKPRFEWRAFMLDESRYFKGMAQVKLLLDEMARLKMNIFHWHLVDDQGWRIEIKKYPLLTELGSHRKSTQVGEKKWKSNKQSGEPHSGFYTQTQIKEIVNYAAQRHITVVPEIEMPGHSSAAVTAYPWLGTENKQIEMPVKFGRFFDIYDVSNPKVNNFIEDVLQEVFSMFPSKVIHIGGDEVSYDAWAKSSKVKAYMENNNLETYADLQVHFTNRISRYIEKKDRRMMGWNEIMGINIHQDFEEKKSYKNAETSLAKNVIVHFWKGDINLLKQAAQHGYDIVNSQNQFTYLDYAYSSISLQKAYDFNPIPNDLEPAFHNRIIGTGCQMWSEWIPTVGEMHYQVFPRLAAYAEVGWTNKDSKNYDQFKDALQPMLKIWETKGIYFATINDAEAK